MREGPDISRIVALIGDPARGSILAALLDGRPLTAGELSHAAGVTPPTASGHLAQFVEAGLLRQHRQGRHHHVALADADVADALESLAGLAAMRGHLPVRTGPRDAEFRDARVCYDHLAGSRAVQMFRSLSRRNVLSLGGDDVALTYAGRDFVTGFGIDPAALERRRRPLCRVCLDWSERRLHLGGALGAALLSRLEALGWLARTNGSRRVAFNPAGSAAFDRSFA